MNVWNQISSELKEEQNRVVLMVVLESIGSSPGRQGFKMMVSSSGKLFGSIGGGFMEHKLVELCKKDLLNKKWFPFMKNQIHKDSIASNKSGMICSGEQTIAFFLLTKKDQGLVDGIVSSEKGVVSFNTDGILFNSNASLDDKYKFFHDENNWSLEEDTANVDELHIVGGGHVGLALSQLGHVLGFKIFTYDDRADLNTVDQNRWAKHTRVDDYSDIGNCLSDGGNKYVVLMSFGYRTDKVVLRSLLDHKFKYLGMMGSKEKVKRLYSELLSEGVGQNKLDKVHSPIGVPINSQTTEEIAISILAEVIKVKRA